MGTVDVDREALLAFEAPDGPVVMVNLFRLKDRTKFGEFLQAMRQASAQPFEAVRAAPIYAGAIGGEFIAGDDYWDTVILFRYPDWKTLCDLSADGDAFDKVQEVRRTYLDDARFILTTPLG